MSECQIHGDLIHVPPSELHALTSPWPFSVWGIDIIGKISPKSSSGHEFILVAIDYFTKWVEAASYARLTSSGVASFIRSHIICRYGVPHELISDRGYISEQRRHTLLLVYGMEAMLPVEIEMGSLRVALEQQIPEADWAQARFDQLNLLDERRLRAADHVRAYQRKMARAFKKRVKPRPLRIGDLVLKVIRGLIRDPRGKFRPNWSGPYFIRELTPEGAAWLMDLDGNRFSEPTNVDQLKSDPSRASSGPWLMGSLYMLHFIYEGMSFDHWVFEPSFLSFLSPYHLGLRYVPCLKTTLRPWDQMSSSQPLLGQVIEIWLIFRYVMLLLLGVASLMCRSDSVVFGLPGSSLTMIDLVSPVFDLSYLWCHTGHIPFHLELGPHFSTLGCHHASPSGRCDLRIFMEVTCATIDDFMLLVLRACRAPDAILGIFLFRMRFADLHGAEPLGVAQSTYTSRHLDAIMLSSRRRPFDLCVDSVIDMDDLGHAFDASLDLSARFTFSNIVVIPGQSYLRRVDSLITILARYMLDPLYVPMEVLLSYQDRSARIYCICLTDCYSCDFVEMSFQWSTMFKFGLPHWPGLFSRLLCRDHGVSLTRLLPETIRLSAGPETMFTVDLIILTS
ncbi:hypothetical protein CK203_094286 [Vitis vinifera]|uniref:Integrase catalytic domain-containing protein n=1 Tax=Vitis vinifera TaxID=29760 RepID=A0A438DZH6_VITVI|nr:hypothetical protein CK203_094286 [Vitis vinifera]